MQPIKNLLLATLITLVPLIGYADERAGSAAVTTTEQKPGGIFFSESAAEQKVLLTAWKECVQDARDNMPAKLKSALTRQEIRDLLRAEEEACLLAIKNEFKVSDRLWKICTTTINDVKTQRQGVDYKQSNPDKDHSLESLDPESFKRIIEALEAYGINPNAVDIIYNDKSEILAYSNSVKKPLIHFTPINDPKMKDTTSAYQRIFQTHCPAHEATHIAEIHGAQKDIIIHYFNQDGHEEAYIQQQQSWKNWIRIHEKIADLMPLLLPQPIGSLESLLILGIEKYLNKKTAITWNKSDPDATHPDSCAELLPWLITICDATNKEA